MHSHGVTTNSVNTFPGGTDVSIKVPHFRQRPNKNSQSNLFSLASRQTVHCHRALAVVGHYELTD